MKDSDSCIGSTGLARQYRSLGEAIFAAIDSQPQRLAIVFIEEDGSRQLITAAELGNDAMDYARALTAIGIEPQDLVILVMPHSRALIAALLGVIYRGAVPCIFPYLTEKLDPTIYEQRVRTLVRESQARAVITFPDFVGQLTGTLAGTGCQVIGNDVTVAASSDVRIPPIAHAADDLAVVQYTSGTTGVQKGVAVSHRSMLNFLDAFAQGTALTAADVVVNWVPLYHDMGLISGLLFPLVGGVLTVLMSPFAWVRDPVSLFRIGQQFNGTFCSMPNFAFNHSVRNIRERDLAGLDLSRWRSVFNGAEPVRHDSLEAFWTRFSPYGLRKSALKTAYGLAENVLTVSLIQGDGPPHVDWVRVSELQAQRRAVPADSQEPGIISIVSNGPPLPSTEVAIVDDHGERVPERHVGEITARSTHMLTGYHRRPDLSADLIRDGWLYTGDIGYLANGELYVCGRRKDVIIVGGRNVHPEDLESMTHSVPAVRPGRAVAFGIADERLGTERVVIVCELSASLSDDAVRAVDRELRRRALQEVNVTLGEVRFVERGWIIKTSSGKLARSANRDKYLQVLGASASDLECGP